MKKILTGVALLLTIEASAFAAGNDAGSRTMNMKIDGMTCSLCAAMLTKKLAPLCADIHIDDKSGKASCIYQNSATPDQVLKVIKESGYQATVE